MFKFKQIRQIVEKYDTHEDAGTCLMLTRNQGDACDVTAPCLSLDCSSEFGYLEYQLYFETIRI